MITKDFIEKQRIVIRKKIESLNEVIEENRKFEEMGSADEDNAKEFEDFEERAALVKNAEKEISSLKRALKRIDQGTYGRCKVDGKPIEIGRLKAYPEAELCITHAKEKKS